MVGTVYPALPRCRWLRHGVCVSIDDGPTLGSRVSPGSVLASLKPCYVGLSLEIVLWLTL